MTLDVHCVWPLAATLGEGPCWTDNALWFVDILGQRVHRYAPDTQGGQSWDAPAPVSFVLPSQGGGMMVGMPGGIYYFKPDQGQFSLRVALEADLPQNRSNDACVGPDGALWIGTMDASEQAASGGLYRYDGRRPQQKDRGLTIANGPCFSPDGRRFYLVDSPLRAVYVYDLAAGNDLRNKRVLIRIEEDAGFPDGLTVDAEGGLWIALWGGGCVRRYGPDGTLLLELPLPCSQPTKVAFGGADLRTLYITTARKGLDDAALRAEPWAGGLLALPSPVPGPVITCYRDVGKSQSLI